MKRPLHRLAVVVTCLTLVLAACGGGDDSAEDTTTSSSSSSTTSTSSAPSSSSTTPPPPVAMDAWPFSGMSVGSNEEADGEVLIAKYSNAPKARPQMGLEQADLLMEVLVEGGVVRILAFFHSQVPETIGPLRSAREVDPKLVEPFNAFFASSGGQPAVMSDISEVAVSVSDGSVPGYFRNSERSAPYNLYLETEALFDVAELETPPNTWFGFSDEVPEGEQALSVGVDLSNFHTTNYRYSALDGGYLRFNGEEMHVSVEDEQLVASTVVTLFVDQISTGRLDGAGAPVPDFDVVGTGDAVVFRDGVAIAGTWERGQTSDFFRLFDESGAEIPLKAGQVWFEFVPTGRTVEWQ